MEETAPKVQRMVPTQSWLGLTVSFSGSELVRPWFVGYDFIFQASSNSEPEPEDICFLLGPWR